MFAVGLIGRAAARQSVKKVAAKESQQIAVVTAEKAATRTAFSTVASVAAKGGAGLAIAGASYSGVKSLTNGLTNVAQSSLAGVGGALDSIGTATGDTLSTLGDAATGSSSILLWGGVAVVAFFFLMPRKK